MAATKAWLKQHAAGAKPLEAALLKFFRDQRRRIVAALGDYTRPVPSIVGQIFHAASEQEKLMAAVSDHIIKRMATGASTELALIRKRKLKTTKAFELQDFKLPDEILSAISAEFTLLEAAPYWAEIQAATSEHLTSILQAGLENGDSGQQIAKAVNQALGGLAKVRSKAIARTETTMAFNAGHQASYEALAADGVVSGKTWLAILNKVTRDDHVAANEQTVAVSADFIVGGEKAKYPGDWRLSAAERVNCRCTTIAKLDE